MEYLTSRDLYSEDVNRYALSTFVWLRSFTLIRLLKTKSLSHRDFS
jgi:hypothetical protein